MVLLAGVLALGVGSTARAQEGATEEEAAQDVADDGGDAEGVRPSPAEVGPELGKQADAKAAAEPGSARWGDGRASRNPRQQPALGSAYAWRQMVMAAVIMLAMLGVVVWIIRRQTRVR